VIAHSLLPTQKEKKVFFVEKEKKTSTTKVREKVLQSIFSI